MISDLTTQSDSVASVPSVVNQEIFFAVPIADQAIFARLPDKVRQHTTTTLTLLARIHHSGNVSGEARAIAFERVGQRGFSAESLERKYYAYKRTQDWRAVLDRAQAGPLFWKADAEAGLPPAFIEFWKSLCERNQRKTAPARRALLEIWRTHRGICSVTGRVVTYKKIPGYDTWPEADGVNKHPKGWSAANLNRHALSKFELAVARHGREPGAQHRRKVFTTRHGLAVGQFYLFDDQEYDLKVNFPGSRNAMRPLGLNALDLYSAYCVSIGLKPTLQGEDGAKQKLKARDSLWMIADVLCNYGYRTDDRGTALVVEHGTFGISAAYQERIWTASGGKVTVDRSGLSSVHMPGLFEGSSKGNPRFKAALESLFNLVRNEMAALPGQVGMDRDHSPTELVGKDRYNSQILKLWHTLPPHRREQLQLPFLAWHDFVELTLDVYHRINTRTDHALEGWEKCKHYVQEFFVDLGVGEGNWLSEGQWLALSKEKRAALQPFTSAKPRFLSPKEVWNRGSHELQKLGECMLPTLLGPEFGEERSVRGGYITVEDRELDTDPIRFPAHPHNSGETFLCYLSPHNIDRLILTDAKGSYVGTLQRQIVPCRADAEAVTRQLGAARREEAARLAPVIGRALPVAEANRDMHRHNLAVVNGQPVTNEELQAARDLRARIKRDGKAATDDMLGCNDPLPPSAEDARAASALECGGSTPLSNGTHAPDQTNASVLDDTSIDEML